MQENIQPQLVPGRECGECQVCCILPSIDKPDIQKISGAPCRHCMGGGCDIYETRPQVCRTYFCGWRRSSSFPDDWRPDKSGIFAELEVNSLPQFQPLAVSLILSGNPLKIVRRPEFIDFVVRTVRNNVAMHLGLPGPRGKQSARLQLNTRPLLDAATRSRADVRLVLEGILKRLTAHTYIPYDMENSGNDVSS